MKKLYLSCAFLFFSFLCHAQITKGTILLGGSLFVSTTSISTGGTPGTTSKYSSYEIMPAVGLAVASNLVLGLDLGLGGQSSNQDTKEKDYTLGAYLRKYKYLGGKFYFFAETDLLFTNSDETYYNDPSQGYTQEDRNSYLALAFAPGVAYCRHWQLEVEFPDLVEASYDHQQTISTAPVQVGGGQSKSTSNTFDFSTNLTTGFDVQVGLRYLIWR